MENYTRVIPRDFFNEAKLLKCMGLLSLAILDCKLPEGINIEIDETGDPFEIVLTDCGSLVVVNYETKVNDIIVTFKTTYNSKSNYPFFCEIYCTDYQVFDENGEFDLEFIEAFKTVA